MGAYGAGQCGHARAWAVGAYGAGLRALGLLPYLCIDADSLTRCVLFGSLRAQGAVSSSAGTEARITGESTYSHCTRLNTPNQHVCNPTPNHQPH